MGKKSYRIDENGKAEEYDEEDLKFEIVEIILRIVLVVIFAFIIYQVGG